MPGFRNVRSFADAAGGRHWISTFRKAVPATATGAGQRYDYGYAGGNPIPNYYASSPLEAAVLDGGKGIYVPRMVAGERQFIHRLTVMVAASSATAVTQSNLELLLLDYLLYYPFVDMDAAGEDQAMVQAASLPRYTDGVGVQMMVVAQAPTIGGGRFTITYVDSDDVTHTTVSMFCGAAQPAGVLVNAVSAVGGLTRFVPLNAGVRGVKRVEAVNFSVANGGLAAVVLVKPIHNIWFAEASRRTTSGVLNSFGAAAEKEAIRSYAGLSEIKDGAFLGIVGLGANGTLASSVLVGTIETVWS